VNPAELAALYERITDAADDPEIRLSCPRGHFIAAIALVVAQTIARLPDGQNSWQNILGMSAARGRYHHHDSPRRHPTPPNPRFTVTSTPRGKFATMTCDRCPGWTLTRDYDRLATELAVYALAGHPEYRF
jgi:hypothetical protein